MARSRCNVKLRHHPCFNTDGQGNLIDNWKVWEGESLSRSVSPGGDNGTNAVVIEGLSLIHI